MVPIDSKAAPPPVRLFTVPQVVLAAFLGTPIGGTALVSWNFIRLGRRRAAFWWAFGGLIGSSGLCTAGFLYGRGMGIAVNVATLGVVSLLSGRCLGPIIKQHRALGGRVAPTWPAIAVGLLGLACVVLVPTVAIAICYEPERLDVDGNTIVYGRGVSRSQAVSVGKVLQRAGWFQGRDAVVQVDWMGRQYIVTLWVNAEAAMADTGLPQFMRQLRDALQETVFPHSRVVIALFDPDEPFRALKDTED